MKKGFTLIELLIVVAIIAILAAIAVPNFLEAQVRAKISRCYADMRSLTTAATTYKVDTNKWIPDHFACHLYLKPPVYTNGMNDPFLWGFLTTPVSYMGTVPEDGFQGSTKHSNDVVLANNRAYYYYADGWFAEVAKAGPTYSQDNFLNQWIILSPGPDKIHDFGEWIGYKPERAANGGASPREYDSSNGTVSSGDIVRFGP